MFYFLKLKLKTADPDVEIKSDTGIDNLESNWLATYTHTTSPY